MRCARRTLLAAACVSALLSFPAFAQEFPVKPIRMIVAFAGGSGGDVTARLMAGKVGELLGQPLVVENQGGAGGAIAADQVARSAPDGYTLLFTTPNPNVMRPLLSLEKVPYHPINDFTPISSIVQGVLCLVAHPSVPFNSVKELVEHAKRNPGLAFGSSGIGSSFHLAGEMLQMMTGIQLTHVPYKGGGPAMNDLLAGQIPLNIGALDTALRYVPSKKIRILAVLSPERYHALPDVPTMAEQVPGFQKPPGWLGVLGPAKLPRPVLARLSGAFIKAAHAPEVRQKLEEAAFVLIASTPEEFLASLRSDIEVTAKIIKAAGIKPQ